MTLPSSRLFSSVAIHVTGKCNIRCSHCMPESGPEIARTLVGERLLSWIAQLHEHGTSYLALTGGEPFMVPDLVASASAEASRRGMTTSVMTNAFWAKSVAAGQAWLDRFPDIARIGISTDRFHWEHIPIDYVRNAIEAARSRGRTVMVRAAYTVGAGAEIDEVQQRLAGQRDLLDLFEAQPVIQIGRARSTLQRSQFFDMGSAAFGRCSVADTPTIDDRGDIYACCGPSMYMGHHGPLFLGNIDREGVPTIAARAESNMALQVVRTLGLGRAHELLSSRTRVPLRERPRHMCELCADCFGSNIPPDVYDDLNADPELRAEVAASRLVQFGDTSLMHQERTASR